MVHELLHINFSPNTCSSRFYILVLKMCGLNCVRSIPSHAPHFKPRYPEMVGLQQMVQCYTCFSNCSLNIIDLLLWQGKRYRSLSPPFFPSILAASSYISGDGVKFSA